MNPSRLFLAIVVGFLFIFASDFVIHSLWLSPDYKATAVLWRPEEDMQHRLFILLGAQLVCAIAIMYIWARTGWRRRSFMDGCVFGFFMGLFGQVWVPILYVVMPLPLILGTKWYFSGLLQMILLGGLAALVYKPQKLGQSPPAS